jgi:NTP pyrophosphatase (non-canonical NTP hydrolase)
MPMPEQTEGRSASFVRHYDGRVHKLSLAHEWAERAEENIEEWGDQRPDTLLLALIEEVGEIADAMLRDGRANVEVEGYDLIARMADMGEQTRWYLKKRGGEVPIVENLDDPQHTLEEVQDAAPLCWQLYWAVDGGDPDA